jgi:CHAT domain-containing protein
MNKDDLEALVNEYIVCLQNPNAKKGISYQVGNKLYNVILKDALTGVSSQKKLIIVPDGVFGLLPFEALIIKIGNNHKSNIYVGDKWNITYSQSAAIFALNRILKPSEARRPIFALGNPIYTKNDPRCLAQKQKKQAVQFTGKNLNHFAFRGLAGIKKLGKTHKDDKGGKELIYKPLPETEIEIKAIAKIFNVKPNPPEILLNIFANETNLRRSPLNEFRYLHFATHSDLLGKLQGINEPFILLGQVDNIGYDDGFLTMSEVLGLSLDADMVVLSACLTGRGKIMEGEGVVSLARAFQHAGARSVVVSLWEVVSNIAVEYMTNFYNYLKTGKTRVEALRLAREGIKNKYPNPFYWSVFILHGEG